MKVLVANRGEIACRILRTLAEMSIPSVALHTDPDRDAPHLDLADEVVSLGAPEAYLSIPTVLAAAAQCGATALHPGYGFLSQNAEFVRACERAKILFLGPSAESMLALGDKRGSRETAERLGIPVIPGAAAVDTLAAAEAAASRVGYPVLLKAAGGGGGKGMRLVRDAAGMKEAQESAAREAASAFGDARLLIEKYVSPARHVEVQILGDGRDAVALGDRECSLQRRYQKILEEAPALQAPAEARAGMAAAAVRLARASAYRNAGTVEFLLAADGSFYFLEVNTRLQVEHPVTELVAGLDVVRCQIELALGAPLPAPVAPRGHAIEVRLNAERPAEGFLPQTGTVLALQWPQRPGIRVDAGIRAGQSITGHYDSLLAKIIAHGADREQARRRLIEALKETLLLGVGTNQSFLLDVLESDFFRGAQTFTTTLESRDWPEAPLPPEIDAAARRLLEERDAPAGNAARAASDPWRELGNFRVGS